MKPHGFRDPQRALKLHQSVRRKRFSLLQRTIILSFSTYHGSLGILKPQRGASPLILNVRGTSVSISSISFGQLRTFQEPSSCFAGCTVQAV